MKKNIAIAIVMIFLIIVIIIQFFMLQNRKDITGKPTLLSSVEYSDVKQDGTLISWEETHCYNSSVSIQNIVYCERGDTLYVTVNRALIHSQGDTNGLAYFTYDVRDKINKVYMVGAQHETKLMWARS